ncbi:SLAM family member 6 isoform 1-T1 [Hipposideros larvatus]
MIWLSQLLTLVFCLGPGNTIAETPLKGVLGESVTLPLEFPAEDEIQSIIWHHNGLSIIFIQPKQALILFTDPKLKEQLNVTQSYSLQIKNLTMANTGLYSAQITTMASSKIFNYTLRIFRRLRNLHVANYTQLSENDTCEIHLTCSVENSNDHVSLRWQVSGNILLEEANLTISWDPKTSSEQTYFCIAENPVSNLSFSFSVQSLCRGVFNEKKQHLKNIWIPIIIVFVFIAIAVCWCLIVRRRKRTGFLSSYLPRLQDFRDLESGALGSSSFSTQQTQSPAETPRNTECDLSSPGNTVYAQITHPNMRMGSPTNMKNNDPATIYSTIYQPKQSNCP